MIERTSSNLLRRVSLGWIALSGVRMTVGAGRRSSALLGRIRARRRSLIGRIAVLGARGRGSGRVRASRVVARLAGLLRRVAAVCNK